MRKRSAVFVLFLVVIILGLYWRTLDYPFIWDDEVFFRNNPLFIERIPFSSALKMSYFSEQLGWKARDHYYRPVLTASFMMENKIWGIRNVTLRATNVVIFLLALIFLYSFLRNQTRKGYFPEIMTLLLALNPLNIDNIVWIVGRADLLLFLWGILALLFLDLAIRKKKAFFWLASSLAYFLALFSKETAILFLPLLLLYEILKRKKVRIFYHSSNLLVTLFAFFLKNTLLGIKNVQFVIYRNIGEDIQAALGTLGYYFRAIIFPISYDMFMPVKKVMGGFFAISGVAAILFILFLINRLRKDRAIAWPLALLIVFLGSHTALIFSNVFPYPIYSRYMMLASLAFFWIVAEYLSRLNEKAQLSVVFFIIVLFIPAIIVNAGSYKSKTAFWQRAYKSLPNDEHVLYERARTFYESKDVLSAEVSLNKILTLNINRETAVMVSLLYADIDMLKANYDNVLRWMKSIEGFEQIEGLYSAPQIRFYINSKIARVAASRGDIDTAENLMTENVQRYGRNPTAFQELYNLYTGFQLWDKAAQFESKMKAAFPRTFAHLDTQKARDTFAAYSEDRRLGFYVLARNFGQAIADIQKLEPLNFDQRLFLAKLYYYLGREEDGQKTIAATLEPEPANIEILNRIGSFYLNELFRVKEAMVYFDRSLSLNPGQPALLYLTNRLKNEYLGKLIEVWK
ncbi:MAG: hypothetical protein QHH14_04320 [Clostridiales bacterium]|nr:hypothetical protein [Clostridiales bacterium]